MESEHERGRVRGRSRLPAEQDSILELRDHDLSGRQLLDQLSHPGALNFSYFYGKQ